MSLLSDWKRFRRALGPGLLMAAAGIGVSHLVQATRAGAEYGFSLLFIVVLVCVLKFPFLDYGPRYTAATGETLLDGYRRLGGWALGVFLLMTVSTMFIIQAAVTLVTAGLAGQLFGLTLSPAIWSSIILVACILLLLIGKYPGLDGAVKLIMALLAISTVAAVVATVLFYEPAYPANPPNYWTVAGIGFVLALMGWMPIPLDVAVWHSLWTQGRDQQTGHETTVRESLLDFHIGYWGSTVLAVFFLLLGALVMYGAEESLATSGIAFSTQLVGMYTASLGSWSFWIISVAVFTTMFSTVLTVTDAYPRVMTSFCRIVFRERSLRGIDTALYPIFLILTTGTGLVIITFFTGAFTTLVDFAATMSFLIAPVFAWMNYRLIVSEHVPENARPGGLMRILSWAGILFLAAFAVIYLLVGYEFVQALLLIHPA